MTSSSDATRGFGPHPVRDAVRVADYERAALRLLYGLLHTLDEIAPEARDELLHIMVERRLPHADSLTRINSETDRHGRRGGHR